MTRHESNGRYEAKDPRLCSSPCEPLLTKVGRNLLNLCDEFYGPQSCLSSAFILRTYPFSIVQLVIFDTYCLPGRSLCWPQHHHTSSAGGRTTPATRGGSETCMLQDGRNHTGVASPSRLLPHIGSLGCCYHSANQTALRRTNLVLGGCSPAISIPTLT